LGEFGVSSVPLSPSNSPRAADGFTKSLFTRANRLASPVAGLELVDGNSESTEGSSEHGNHKKSVFAGMKKNGCGSFV